MRALLRLRNPYLRDGPGAVYLHGCILRETLDDFRAQIITWDELLDEVDIKIGSTNNLTRQQGEYRACEEDYVLFSWDFWITQRRRLVGKFFFLLTCIVD